MIAHLGMSGSFRIEEATPGAFHHGRSKGPKHDHVVVHLDTGKVITYNDPRRFGFMDLARDDQLDPHPRLASLGDEPLAPDFDGARLAALFAGSRAPLKSALLDQKRIAGLGNIYVCEALFRAKLSPFRPAGDLANAQGRPDKIRAGACKSNPRGASGGDRGGGSTLRDHRQADGELGYFQHTFAVDDREGRPAEPGCRGTIARYARSARSTFYCPVCQK